MHPMFVEGYKSPRDLALRIISSGNEGLYSFISSIGGHYTLQEQQDRAQGREELADNLKLCSATLGFSALELTDVALSSLDPHIYDLAGNVSNLLYPSAASVFEYMGLVIGIESRSDNVIVQRFAAVDLFLNRAWRVTPGKIKQTMIRDALKEDVPKAWRNIYVNDIDL